MNLFPFGTPYAIPFHSHCSQQLQILPSCELLIHTHWPITPLTAVFKQWVGKITKHTSSLSWEGLWLTQAVQTLKCILYMRVPSPSFPLSSEATFKFPRGTGNSKEQVSNRTTLLSRTWSVVGPSVKQFAAYTISVILFVNLPSHLMKLFAFFEIEATVIMDQHHAAALSDIICWKTQTRQPKPSGITKGLHIYFLFYLTNSSSKSFSSCQDCL